jgi:hypothetical protein
MPEGSRFHSPLTTGGLLDFVGRGGSMVFDVKPEVFPSRKVGGEFICKVSLAGLLSQLDAGAPYHGEFFRGWLGFHAEEEAE